MRITSQLITAAGLCWMTAAVVAADPAAPLAEAPLADAVKQKKQLEIEKLLAGKTDVNAAQVDGMTALHWAAYYDDAELVTSLLAAGAKAKVQNRYGVTPLSLACTNGNADIVTGLLEAGADPNTTLRGGETVLMTAARTGRLGPVQALLDRGADVNAEERRGQTALMWAAAEGHDEVVAALLAAGADVRASLSSGFNPFFFAVREGREEVALRLLAAGLDINEIMRPRRSWGNGPKKGTTALLLAVENGHFELAAALLKAGANPHDKALGYTPLHAITWVRKPLRGDGDPPPLGSGALSSLDFVRELVARGADVNVRHKKRAAAQGRLNKTDATPFLLAAETADLPLLKLLLELGADPTLVNADHTTPLLAAAGVGVLGNGDETAGTEAEAIEAIELLLELGADINAVDDRGESAMHGAAYKSWVKLVKFLSDRGADVNVWHRKNHFGWTPLMIAQGHRPGNFRPSAATMAAVQQAMRAAGVEPPQAQTARGAPARNVPAAAR